MKNMELSQKSGSNPSFSPAALPSPEYEAWLKERAVILEARAHTYGVPVDAWGRMSAEEEQKLLKVLETIRRTGAPSKLSCWQQVEARRAPKSVLSVRMLFQWIMREFFHSR